MNIPGNAPRDFNPLTDRDLSAFGYSPLDDALTNVFRFLGVYEAPALPRGEDGNHWTTQNLKDPFLVAQACPFGYWKGTEGTWFVDDSKEMALTLRQAGQIQFLYLFLRRNVPGAPQADWFDLHCKSLVGQIGGKKICLIDYETSDGVTNSVGNGNFVACCQRLKNLGYLVGLYTAPGKAIEYALDKAWVNNEVDFYILAHYKSNNSPTYPANWDVSKVMAQQEGVIGKQSWCLDIPGLVPEFDANLLLWPLSKLETFTGQKWTPTPLPVPPPTGDIMLKGKCILAKVNVRALAGKPGIDGGDLFLEDTFTYLPAKIYKSPDGKEEWWPIYADKLVNGLPLTGYAAYKHPDYANVGGFGLVEVP